METRGWEEFTDFPLFLFFHTKTKESSVLNWMAPALICWTCSMKQKVFVFLWYKSRLATDTTTFSTFTQPQRRGKCFTFGPDVRRDLQQRSHGGWSTSLWTKLSLMSLFFFALSCHWPDNVCVCSERLMTDWWIMTKWVSENLRNEHISLYIFSWWRRTSFSSAQTSGRRWCELVSCHSRWGTVT